jgi:hypothetical protein
MRIVTPEPASAGATELLLDVPVGGRLGWKLVECFAEEGRGVFVPALAMADEAEVRDHLPLVLLVPELPQQDECLFEVLNGRRDATGVDDGQSEVVESQRLHAFVLQLAGDRESCSVLLGSLLVLALAPKLSSALVEAQCVLSPIDRFRIPRANLQKRASAMRGKTRCVLHVPPEPELLEAQRALSPIDKFWRSRANLQKRAGAMRGLGCSMLHVPPELELVEARL